MRFILLCTLLLACENPPKETRADRIAKAVCQCATPLLELNRSVAAAPQAADFEKIQTAFEAAKTCIADQRMKPEDLSEVEKVLPLQCPALANEAELLSELLGKNE